MLTTMRAVTSAVIRIEFEEIGLSESDGTFLDDVRVGDLGLSQLP